MTTFAELVLRNAVLAAVLAVAVAVVARVAGRPALAHALWLLVLLRLVMPPIWTVSVRAAVTADVPPASALSAGLDAAPPPGSPDLAADDPPADDEPAARDEPAAEPAAVT